ncbi:hypothetical protein [Eubacterium aggregans]|uniref:hypothetical protein n=1 Tax=Eubacterium aggregans TaxID=81409 RepID=UPI003F3C035C
MALVLKNAAAHLTERGLMLLRDFYTDHWETKSRLSDINMLVNTYNGRAYDSTWVTQALKDLGLATTGLTPWIPTPVSSLPRPKAKPWMPWLWTP